jgi:beta-glucosidase
VYRPGDEGGPAIAGTLFGDYLPSGRLPWQLPRSIAQVGVDDSAHWSQQPDKWDLPFDLGATTAELAQIRALIAAGQPVPPTFGDPLFQYGDGIQGFGSGRRHAAAGLQPADAGRRAPWSRARCPPSRGRPPPTRKRGSNTTKLFLDGADARDHQDHHVHANRAALGNGAHSWRVRAFNWAGGFTDLRPSIFTIDDTTRPRPSARAAGGLDHGGRPPR